MKTAAKKLANIITGSAVALLVVFLLSGSAYAFHEGGAGYCEGCHVLHDSSEASNYLLRGSDPSSTCLRCHSEKGELHNIYSDDGSSFTPGGDFYWVQKTFTWNERSILYGSEADNHGHNIVASDYGLYGDARNSTAPGDAYPSASMGCTSCHNPHGTVTGNDHNLEAVSVSGSYDEEPAPGTTSGNYRLLGGVGYNGGVPSGGFSFEYTAPVAVADPDDWSETDTHHTAYGSGMSEWCANCHWSYLVSDNKHVSGNDAKLSPDIIANYNLYVRTGNINGIRSLAYLALVPFEMGTSDKSQLDPSGTSGPDWDGRANVMCLTCHRAHASAFDNIGRWDFQATFIADSHPRYGDGGVTGDDVLNSYYGRSMTAGFGSYQRQLCNKCHVQD